MVKDYKGFKIRIDLITTSGSHLYGNSTPESDYDYRGIFTISTEDKNRLISYPTRISDPKWMEELSNEYKLDLKDFSDIELFEITDFFKLSMDCNPNIMDILFTDDEATLYVSPEGQTLIANKELFLSKKIKHTFSGYAMAQLKRIKGHNKWIVKYPDTDTVIDFLRGEYNLGNINKHWISDYFSGELQNYITDKGEPNWEEENPDPISFKKFEDVVNKFEPKIDLGLYKRRRFIDYTTAYDLKNTSIGLDSIIDDIVPFTVSEEDGGKMSVKQFLQTKASFRKLNETILMIYTDGKGIFGREGKLKSNDSEFIGEFVCLVKIDHHNHKKDNDDVQKMWKWKTHRNEKRSVLEEKYGYDTKHASHLARLMRGCENILNSKEYHPRLTGDDLIFVKDVRAGKYSYEWILKYAEEMDSLLSVTMEKSDLQHSCDKSKVDELHTTLSFEDK